MLASAFEFSSTPVAPWRRPTLFSASPLALLFGISGCVNQTPDIDEQRSNSDGGGGVQMGGVGGAGGVLESDGGAGGPVVSEGGGASGASGGDAGSDPICQVQFPIGVLFYNCIEMAASGQKSEKVCLSDRWYGGDVSLAKNFINNGFAMTHDLYVESCSPVSVKPVIIFPDRALDAKVDSPDFEFVTFSGKHTYGGSMSKIENDLAVSGLDLKAFGAITVVNPWDHTLLPMHVANTLRLIERTEAPFSRISINIAVSDPILPVSIKSLMRHEDHHVFNHIAERTLFSRLLDAHDPTVNCPYPWDAHWLCLLHFGNDGIPLSVEDWQLSLGASAVPISCNDPKWKDQCETNQGMQSCGASPCPELHGFAVECNPQNYCEYHRQETTQAWHSLDRWIYVPPGSHFMMGTEASALGHTEEEAPVHSVNFAQGFFIGKYEVTVEAFEACVQDGACESPILSGPQGTGWGLNTSAARPLHPANHVTWEGALNVCEWIYPGARHPNAPEWEFAARGLQGYLFPHGNSVPTCGMNQGNFNEQNTAEGFGCGSGGTIPVNAKQVGVSPIGAFGMAGNVWEWTTLCRYPNYNNAPSNGLPDWSIPCSYGDRDLRGGGYNDTALKLRAPGGYHANYKLNKPNIGVRCALSAYWVHP